MSTNILPSNMPHVGQLIRTVLDKRLIRLSTLGRLMHKTQSTVSHYPATWTLKMHLIWELSHALKYNFFMYYASLLPPDYEQNENAYSKKLIALEQENKELKQAVELYKDLLKK